MPSQKIKDSKQYKSWNERIPLPAPQALNPACPVRLIYTAGTYDVFSTLKSCFHLFLNETF